ncbi:L-alanine dehydrogenase [Thermanaeromonas toyohensis ToBE]|uniref:Alanine dehydrogenase n=1 Tax=Thermanaeromonas toyohensis ToBE TaxID=698762 RepID=A0A1W1V7U9_9FIRM|nr:alanine dehydrogenase [Thermanaeromonas toyohensis]SMB89111.1 L-alanine dehydrogenase [Thermanaeromonas toyohensis ToBE]
MIIGLPREIKPQEHRVGLTPAGVDALVRAGHQVIVERGAGEGSGFSDKDYHQAGAQILTEASQVWAEADMIVKVKEPLPVEYNYFKPGLVLFTYLHLAAEPELTKVLAEKQVTAIAYETVELPNGSLPLLTPMSEVAGRMSIQVGASFLEKPRQGKGILLGGVAGVPPAHVVILGGGTVGTSALKRAVGMGARVTVIDKNLDRLRYLDDVFHGQIETLASNHLNIATAVQSADLVIGAVLIPGARAPRLVTEEMVRSMEPGSVIVDVAVDQGGCVETIDHPTTHEDPIYIKHGVVHYAVANMPGAVPRTSTLALTHATLPYVLALANKGWIQAVKEDPALAKGVNVVLGRITNPGVAEAHGLAYYKLEEVLKELET